VLAVNTSSTAFAMTQASDPVPSITYSMNTDSATFSPNTLSITFTEHTNGFAACSCSCDSDTVFPRNPFVYRHVNLSLDYWLLIYRTRAPLIVK